ncbi:MAG TPA: HPr(Ser) kinase/phosphatase [candidate division Zixibacteria bacterium]|nr:HPr(Ser) kinase/phosphatase [candidate division Zixibacteria bacterium]MDD4918982.1 HPr(Ser) kinase/phosphatase [candidate division Zixibacteria bacterium]MDM7972919.1 HPr(Ser) kinase/phosphatase [candidate division Zixibacteria bacterium]HOZ08334.1 HPr(Ser) kinase/phosphatase [candidate division Zixibacteria bacterium]HPI31878.1 HPr(Ser) kinase/phosphatase [candidate division Zixibacteria bacterium]
MSGITVEKLYTTRTQDLELTLLNSSTAGLNKVIHHPELHRPGLALTGFFERFANRRVQIVGETEMAYMNRLPLERLAEISHLLFEKDIPMVIISKGLTPPPEFLDAADRHRTGVFSSRLTTAELAARLSAYLDHIFAPSITVHGTLVDVYGVGLLYTGKSGIGKSEVALDLIERGHRLVADDVVKITRAAPDVVKGSGSELLGHHMEIRGVGIIDIEGLFGIRAIRMQKRIEVEVNLTLWSETDDYERLGLEERYTTILGVQIPIVRVPISPGKNITVISEVIAMNHMLKVYGENSALEFSKRLSQQLSRQSLTKDYLESDFE